MSKHDEIKRLLDFGDQDSSTGYVSVSNDTTNKMYNFVNMLYTQQDKWYTYKDYRICVFFCFDVRVPMNDFDDVLSCREMLKHSIDDIEFWNFVSEYTSSICFVVSKYYRELAIMYFTYGGDCTLDWNLVLKEIYDKKQSVNTDKFEKDGLWKMYDFVKTRLAK